jgi:PKD repeat protein
MKKTLTLFIGLILALYSTAQITGDTSVCKGETTTYSVPYISGAGYYWTVTGGSIVGAPTADSVVVQWSNTGTAIIVLSQINPAATFTMNVVIHALPNPVITHAAYPGCPTDTGNVQGGSGQPDHKAHCEKVCKLATVTYATPFNALSTYQWYVTGAQTVTGATTDSVTITWDTTSIGTVLVVETNQWGCVDSAYLCIEKIDLPVASFTHQASACKFSTIPFTNTSSGASTYQWYFGDGGSSTLVHPTHSYATAGMYTITLIAFNNCFCSDTFTSTISIDSLPGPDIACPSTVCAFDTATYSTTPAPGCTYTWFAIGGTIVSGQGTPNVTVAWGAGQVGTLGLTITGCGGVCADTTLIQIPIVPSVATIMGDTVVCPGDCQTYTLPLFSGAGYTWTLNSNCGGVLSDTVCCNEVEICWPTWAAGCNDTLTVQYYDSFLHCGGTGMLFIRVRPELSIAGPPSACANSTTTLFNIPGIACTWTVSPTGPIVAPPIGTSTTINWNNLPGNYTVMAVPVNPNQTCSPFALSNITVSAKPAAPVITGDTVVCAGSSVSYCANPSTNVTNWIITGGTPATFMGSCVTVTWNLIGPYSISAFNQMPGSPMCSSDTTVQSIQAFNVIPIPNIIGLPNACANATSVYNTTTPYPASATYNWSVAPSNAGSVIGGQGSTTATFEWGNNAPQNVTVTLTVTVCGQNVSNNTIVALNPAPTVTAVQVGSLCAGGTAQVQATGGNTYQWSGPGGFSSILNPAPISLAGLYQVTATAINGCTALSQVNVQYVSGPTAAISTLSYLNYCIGATYTVNICALGNANYTYAWNVGGPTTQCRNFTTPGAYSVVVTDITNNCTALSNTLVVVEDSCNGSGPGTCTPNGSVSFTQTNCNPVVFTNTSVNASGFSWNFGDLTGSGLTNPTHN